MQAQQLWQAVLGDLQGSVSRNAFDNWLRHTSIVGFNDDLATVVAANMFSASTLQQRYASQVERVLSEHVGRPISVRFTVMTAELEASLHGDPDTDSIDADGRAVISKDEPAQPSSRSASATTANAPARQSAPPRPSNTGRDRSSRPQQSPAVNGAPPRSSQQLTLAAPPAHGLSPRYTYDTYVVGSSNRFAHAASLSVADRPGQKYNPFYVYGGVGLGKTHLIHAIGHRALAERPDMVIRYVSSEKFTNDLINALKARTDMEEFRSKYRLIDILMIDDIQFIAGKEATMEEFFHTFNTLQQSGKQVIITSDKPPKAIGGLEERLRSRFEGGLMADVQAPDYEMRMAILRAKSEELGVAVPGDVAEYVAAKDQTNIRELEGALNKIVALAELTNRPVALNLAMEALTNAAMFTRRPKLTAGAIIDTVAGHYNVATKDLQGRSRTKDIVAPRQVAMYLIREETDASLVEIGQALGGRDHTTVMHGISKIERDLTTDTGLRTRLMTIREVLFTGER